MKANEFDLLVWKQLQGELTEAEALALAEWLGQSPENQREAERIRRIWQKSEPEFSEIRLDLEADFAKVQSRIRAERPQAKIVRLPVWQQTWVRAAAIALLLSAGIWAFRQSSNNLGATQQAVVQAANGENRVVELPDGSKIWLRNGSRLEHPVVFSANERRVKLSGEAFFSVVHNPQQPFRVENQDGTEVQVLGTEFDVRSKPDEAETFVTVKSGKVRFSHAVTKTEVVLVAQQKGIFSREQQKIRAFAVGNMNDMAWQTGGLSFVKTPLRLALNDMEKHYEIHITLENKTLEDCTYTAPLINQGAPEALSALAVSFGCKLSMLSPGRYSLSGGRCK